MNINVKSQPTPDSTRAGDLYVDLQSRQLWLGVDTAVDPSGSVLISDINYLEDAIDASLVQAKAYTDNQLTTRAPVVHTHTASQITDFNAAVTAVINAAPGIQYVRGMILIYSGALTSIGVGSLAGWALCDGSNGTPDLRDKFVIGAGNKLPGAANPFNGLTTPSGGSHIHVVNGTAITGDQMPYHSHTGITGYVSHDHAHYVNLNTGGESVDHNHSIPGPATTSATGGIRPSGSGGTGNNIVSSGRNVAHYHSVSGATGGITQNHYHGIPAEGGNAAHDHTMQYAGDHAHVVPANTLRDSIPYFAYSFIMKL